VKIGFHVVRRHRTLAVILAFSTLITSTVKGAESSPLKLRVGECSEIDGMKVKFSAVLEDSRCPEGEQCVSAGNARVQLQITQPRGRTRTLELNTQTPPLAVSVDHREIKILDLVPYPRNGRAPKPDTYVLTLGIEQTRRGAANPY